MKMFTENFKNMLFWVVSVAHESSYDYFFFNQKHKSLIYKAIKVYYKQNQNDGTRFGTHHVSLLSHVCQDKAQHTDFQDG